MSISNQQRRIIYIDMAKGLGMLTVIWGHIMLIGPTNIVIYAFHMPLFFFLSGMLFKKENYTTVAEFIKKRIRTLLIPYVLFSIATWALWLCYNIILGNTVKSYFMPLLQTILSQGSGEYLIHNSPLWFVTCLFIVEILFYFISKLKECYKILIMSFACAIIGCFMIQNNSPFRYLPWSIDMALCALPFYATGNIVISKIGHQKLYDMVVTHKTISLFLMVILFALLCVGALANGPVSMGHRIMGKIWLFYLTAPFGIIFTLIISMFVSSWSNRITYYLCWIGKNSFYVMATQTPIKGAVIAAIARLMHLTNSQVSSSYVYSGVTFAVTLLAVTIIVKILNSCIIKIKSMQTV